MAPKQIFHRYRSIQRMYSLSDFNEGLRKFYEAIWKDRLQDLSLK